MNKGSFQAEKKTETKNFRVVSELVSFYSFIQENNLRHEALMIIKAFLGIVNKKPKKKTKRIQ